MDVKIWILSTDLWYSLRDLIQFSNCSRLWENAISAVLLRAQLWKCQTVKMKFYIINCKYFPPGFWRTWVKLFATIWFQNQLYAMHSRTNKSIFCKKKIGEWWPLRLIHFLARPQIRLNWWEIRPRNSQIQHRMSSFWFLELEHFK